MIIVKRAYKYRFYPTPEQEMQLVQTFGCVRYVYNRALFERSEAWRTEKRSVGYLETSKWLTSWKQEEAVWLRDASAHVLQVALRNLQSAFENFFKKRGKYPRFKAKGKTRDSAIYYQGRFSLQNGKLKLAKQSQPLNVVWHRSLPEDVDPSQVTVSRDKTNRWFVSILVEDAIQQLPVTDNKVGVDLGIEALATLSTGEKIANPRHEKKNREKLARAQRNHSKKKKGSRNKEKARLKLARVYAKITDTRNDYLHKLTTRLVRENQVIAIENLNVKGVQKNHKLARAISDASWRELRRQLEYKSDWYGRTLVVADRFYPSTKTCSACGVVRNALPLNVRAWTCEDCGTMHDRDVNAAKNILTEACSANEVLAVGHTVLACGVGVKPIVSKETRVSDSEAGIEPGKFGRESHDSGTLTTDVQRL